MATSNWTIEGGGVELDSKKNLVVTTYDKTVDLTATEFKDSGAKGIDASKATNALTFKAGDKAITFTTGSKNATVIGGKGADKINLGSGSNLVQFNTGNAGNDVINDYVGSKDVIEIVGKTASQATFTDKNASVVITFNGSKEKLTVNKKDSADKISLKFSDGNTTYGDLPAGVTFSDKSTKTAINIGSTTANNATIDASKLASTAKTIDATKANSKVALNLIGNGQSNTISLGGGGGTVYGGYSYDAAKGSSKATADKLYGGDGKDVFLFDASLGGADQIFGYDSADGDIIKITDKSIDDIKKLLADTKTFKDSGKNVVLTLDKSKLTIDGTPKRIFFADKDDATVAYGPTMPSDNAYIDQKKTTLYIPATGQKQNPTLSASVSDTVYSEYNFAPKLKAIDASAYEGAVILGNAESSIATDLKAGTGGSTLIGSTNADNLYGGTTTGTADVFVYTVNSLVGGGKDKIYKFNGIAEGDIIKIDGYDADIHSLVLTEKSGKSLNISINNKANNKSIGQIDINENPTNKTIVVVDGENNIIGVNPATTPIGLAYNEKTGIVTDDKYTGAYEEGSYLIGDNLSDGTEAKEHSDATATIRASDYSAKLAVINASNVNAKVDELLIEGNANAKNVLTAPNTNAPKTTLQTTLKGGLTGADVLNGSTLSGATDYFYVTPNVKSAKKDTVVNYDETDWIVIQATQNIQNLDSLEKNSITTNNAIKFDDKSADAVLTLEKSVITIKDGAGKKLNLMLVNEEGASIDSVDIGHILPNGLKYDAKKVSIAVKDKATTEAADVGGDNSELGLDYGEHEGNEGNKGYIKLDLNNDAYFSTTKTINLSKINDKIPTADDKTSISDNAVHVTLLGNALANDFYAGGNESSTTIFYGGKGDLNKPEADKFYGGKGTDVFVYQFGDGKDQISDNKSNANTKYDAKDWIVLAGGSTESVLSKDNLFITDSGSVVNVQINTDTKKGTLVINKNDTNTPIKFVLTKDSDTALSVASQITSGNFVEDDESDDYKVYDYGLSDDTLATELSAKGVLTVSGTKNITLDGIANATINAKDISSALKNVNITASDVAPYIIGNNNANTITLGKAGGTVDGGYSQDAKGKIKATADKYYGGDGADVFVYTNLYDAAQNDLGGKDIIYNYDPGNDAILINSISDIKDVKYSEKNVVFTFNGAKAASKNNTLTIQGIKGNANSLPSDTQITFLVNSDTGIVPVTYTYFDKKATTKLEHLEQVFNPWEAYKVYNGADDEENEPWTAEDDAADLDVWHYTGNSWTNNGLNFTINFIADHYANTVPSGHIDVNVNAAGIRPVGVSVDEPGGNIINVAQVKEYIGSGAKDVGVLELTDFTFNANTATGANGIHINGIKPVYSSTGLYDASYVAPVGEYGATDHRGEYRLADLDGIAANGYELLKYNYNWDLIQGDKQTWMYHNAINFTLTADRILDVYDYNSEEDGKEWNIEYEGSPVEVHVSDLNMTVGSAIAANQIKFSDITPTGIDGVHINGFDTDTTFTLNKETASIVSGKQSNVTVPTTFVLAELDGDTDNGYELLKKNDRWKLTPSSWDYSSGTTKFSVNIVAPTLAADENGGLKGDEQTGAPAGIEVRLHPSVASGAVASLGAENLSTASLGTVIDFTRVKLESEDNQFDISMVAFDGGISTGKRGVHIKGIANTAGSTVAVGENAYWLVNLDNDMTDDYRQLTINGGASYTNGLELTKVNEKWTPVFDGGYASNQKWAYGDDNVHFTIASGAVTLDKNGENTDKLVRKAFDIDNSTGAVKNITVTDGVINVASALTAIDTTSKINNAAATLSAVLPLVNIAFDSDTKVGKEGIHIKGYKADEVTYIEDIGYQLVDLDGNSSNGYELMKVDTDTESKSNLWSLEDGAWTYGNSDANLHFTFDKNSGLAANDDGTPIGVSVKTADEVNTISFSLEGAAQTKALNSLSFLKFNEGANGIHVQGLSEDQIITLKSDWSDSKKDYTTTTKYQLVELDNDTTDGYEIMKVDDNWKLSNGAWTFADATNSTLEFSISAHASIGADSEGSGKPATITYDSSTKTLDMSEATNFIATDLSITKIANSNKALTGSSGLHIHLATTSYDANIISPDTQYKIGADTYQLVDLDEKAENNDYELMKVDSNWSLKGGKWSYANGAISFDIALAARQVANNNVGLKASDTGVPIGATVTAASGNATLALDSTTFTDLSNVEITGSNYGTVSGALHIKGATALEGSEVTIGTATQLYKLINLDNNANNGNELMKVNDNWTYKVGNGVEAGDAKSWTYSGSTVVGGNDVNLKFKITSEVALTPTAEGTPSATSVNMSTFTITTPYNTKMVATNGVTGLVLTEAATGTGVTATHFNFTGGTVANIEGKTIKVGENSYALYNADGSSDGTYELTHDGWTPSTVNGFTSTGRESSRDTVSAFRYKSSKADYYLSGEAFGDSDTPANVSVDTAGKLTVNTPTDNSKIDTSRDAFHIRIDNAPSTVTTLKVNGVDFTLKNIDNNTSNGYELVNGAWAKAKDDDNNNLTFINSEGSFTLGGSVLDTDGNNIPDGITYTHSSKTFTFDSSTFTSTSNVQSITFTAARNWKASVAAEGVDGYTFTIDSSEAVAGGLCKYVINGKSSNGQLPAEGYSTSGYEVDDLLNYEGESALVGDELGSILDVKPLAAEDEFNVSTLFDGGDRSALTSLTHSTRHRQKK